jgi:formylglycine-generating enzyme required for sulfatase activity
VSPAGKEKRCRGLVPTQFPVEFWVYTVSVNRAAALCRDAVGVGCPHCFRLPSDEEWVYVAGSRFRDSEGARDIDSRDPGKRALDRHEKETAIKNETDPEPRPVGHFGANGHDLLDLAGNVWEWTNSCFARGIIDAGDEPSTTTVDCGVRVVEGRHRTHLTDFIRDARAGGRTAGLPPSNLGFRPVLDDDWRRRLRAFADQLKRALTDQAI